jgi:mannose-6-phosphate isomerase-like protein (cupin superfamily)
LPKRPLLESVGPQERAYLVRHRNVGNGFALPVLVVRPGAAPEQEPDDLPLLLDGVQRAATAAAGVLDRQMKRGRAALVPASRLRPCGQQRLDRRRASAAHGPVQRRNRRKTLRLAGGVRWERLTAAPDNEVEFLYVVYDAGAASCEADSLVRHGGKEYAYMLSGRLGVKIGFDEFQLGPGDSISFDAQSPHRLWAVGREPAIAVWIVLNRHGDRRVGKSR